MDGEQVEQGRSWQGHSRVVRREGGHSEQVRQGQSWQGHSRVARREGGHSEQVRQGCPKVVGLGV